MWDRFFGYILKSYLGEYIEGAEELNVGIANGKAVLNNVSIKENAFDWTGIPLKVQKGSKIEKLQLNVNLAQLSTKPVVVHIENVDIIIALPEQDNPHLAVERMQNLKRRKVKTHELYEEEVHAAFATEEGADVPSANSKKTSTSRKERVLQKIFGNLRVHVVNLNMRYLERGCEIPTSFDCGIHVGEIGFESVDGRWQPLVLDRRSSEIVTSEEEHISRKLAFVHNLSIFTEEQRSQSQRSYILNPTSIEAKISINAKPSLAPQTSVDVSSLLDGPPQTDGRAYKFVVDASIRSLGLSFESSQLALLSMVLQRFQTSHINTLRMLLREHRPKESATKSPKEWWKYSLFCISAHLDPKKVGLVVDQKRGRMPWRVVTRLLLMQQKYIVLWKRKIGAPWLAKYSGRDGEEMVELETRLTFEQILLFRRLARAELNAENIMYASKKHGTNVRKVLNIKRRKDKSKHVLSDQQRSELYESLLSPREDSIVEDEDQELESSLVGRTRNASSVSSTFGSNISIKPINFLDLRLNLGELCLKLANSTTKYSKVSPIGEDASTFCMVKAEAVTYSFQTNSQSAEQLLNVAESGYFMSLVCSSISAKDAFNEQHVYPPLLSWEPSRSQNLFSLVITRHADEMTSDKLTVRGQAEPLNVVLNPTLCLELGTFLSSIADVSSSAKETLTQLSTQQIRNSIEAKVVVDFGVHIGAPKIILPTDVNNKDVSVYVLDLGVVSLVSGGEDMKKYSNMLSKRSSMAVKSVVDEIGLDESSIYDLYLLKMVGIGICAFNNAPDWKINAVSQIIVNQFDVVTGALVSILPEDDRVPLMKTTSFLPELTLRLPRSHFKKCIELLHAYTKVSINEPDTYDSFGSEEIAQENSRSSSPARKKRLSKPISLNPFTVKPRALDKENIMRTKMIGRVLYIHDFYSPAVCVIIGNVENFKTGDEILALHIVGISGNVTTRAFDATIENSINKIDIIDCQRNRSHPDQCVLLLCTGTGPQEYAIRSAITTCNPVSANYRGFDTEFLLELGCVKVNWDNETVTEIASLFPRFSSTSRSELSTVSERERAFASWGRKTEGAAKISCSIHSIEIDMNKLKEGRSLIRIILSHAIMQHRVLENDDADVALQFSNISVLDRSTIAMSQDRLPARVDLRQRRHSMTSTKRDLETMPEIFGLRSSEGFILDLQYSAKKATDHLFVNAGSIKFVFLHTLTIELIDYIDEGVTKVIADRVVREAQAVFDGISVASKTFNIEANIEHPLVIVPAIRHTYRAGENDLFQFDLGQLSAKNQGSIEEHSATFAIVISDASMVAYAKGTGDFWSEHVKMVDNFDARIELNLRSSGWTSSDAEEFRNRGYLVPGISSKIPPKIVSVVVQTRNVDLVCSQSQFATFENLLAWNFDDWMQDKAVHATPKLPLFLEARQQKSYIGIMADRPVMVQIDINIDEGTILFQRGWGRHLCSPHSSPQSMFRVDIGHVDIGLKTFIGRVVTTKVSAQSCSLRYLESFRGATVGDIPTCENVLLSFRDASECPVELHILRHPAADMEFKLIVRGLNAVIHIPSTLLLVNYFLGAHDYDEGSLDVGCRVLYRLPGEGLGKPERQGIIVECHGDYTFSILLDASDVDNGELQIYPRLCARHLRSEQRVQRFVNRRVASSFSATVELAKVTVVDCHESPLPFLDRAALIFLGGFQITAAKNREASLKLQFDFKGIQMWQRFHLSGKEHIIVEQFDLIINFSQQIFMTSAKNSLGLEKRCFYNQMEVGIEGVNFTLGVPHIQVISKLVQSIVDFTSGKQDKTYCDGSTTFHEVITDDNRTVMMDSECSGRFAGRLVQPVFDVSELDSRYFENEVHFHVVLNISQMRLIIVSDCYRRGNTIPILRVRLSNVCSKLAITDGEDTIFSLSFLDPHFDRRPVNSERRLRTGISIYFYNPHVVTWEPLLEPWRFDIESRQAKQSASFLPEKKHDPSFVKVRSMEDLCLNVSHSLIQSLHLWWDSELSLITAEGADDNLIKPSSTLHYEYVLENATGLPLKFAPSHQGDQTFTEVPAGGIAPFSFPQTLIHENWYENPWANLHSATISVSWDALPSKPLKKVQVEKVGKFVYSLEPVASDVIENMTELEQMFMRKEWHLPRILCDISLEGGSIHIRLASLTRVVNTTSTVLELLLCGGPAAAVVETLPPSGSCSLPIHLMHHGRLTVRPKTIAGKNDYEWWEGIDLFPLFDQGATEDKHFQTVTCLPLSSDEMTWVSYLNFSKFEAAGSKSNYYELSLFSPVVLVNALPYPIFFTVREGSGDQRFLVDSVIEPGVTSHFNRSPLGAHELLMYLSFDGTMWSRGVHVEPWRRREEKQSFWGKRTTTILEPPANFVNVPWPTQQRTVTRSGAKVVNISLDHVLTEGKRTVVLFCPYWLINRSMLSLAYVSFRRNREENRPLDQTQNVSSKLSQRHSALKVKRQSFSEFMLAEDALTPQMETGDSEDKDSPDEKDVRRSKPDDTARINCSSDKTTRPILYSGSDRISIAVNDSEYSSVFSINAAGTDGVVSCKERKASAVERLLNVANKRTGVTKHLSEAASRHLYQIGVSLKSAPGVYRRSTMVILSPRYVVINRLKADIEVTQTKLHSVYDFVEDEANSYKQNDLYAEEKLVLHAGDGSPFHWFKAPAVEADIDSLEMTIRIAEKGWRWSGGFSIENIRGLAIKLRNDITGNTLVVRVEIKSEDTTSYILVSEENVDIPLYKFINRSGELMHYKQKANEGDVVVERIFPNESKIFGWDFPSASDRVLTISNSSGRSEIHYRLDEIGMKRFVYGATDGMPNRRPRRVKVYTEVHGPTKALIFADASSLSSSRRFVSDDFERRDSIDQLDVSRSSSKDGIEMIHPQNHLLSAPPSITIENYCCHSITIGLGSAKICLIDKFPREVMLISLVDIVVAHGLYTHGDQSIEVLVKDLQIDNQLTRTLFPVFLASIPRRASPQPFFHISLAKPFVSENVDFFSYVSVLLQEFQVSIDQTSLEYFGKFIISMLAIFNKDGDGDDFEQGFNSGSASAFDVNNIGLIDLNLSDTLLKAVDKTESKNDSMYHRIFNPSRQVYVQLMHLHPLKIRLKFAATTLRQSSSRGGLGTPQRKPSSNIPTTEHDENMSVLPPSIKNLLVDIDNASIKMNALLHTDVFVDLRALSKHIQKHYIGQATADLYRIVGAVDVLGNPVGFVHGLGTGMADFFYEPAQGLIRSPAAFGLGIAKGTYSLVSGVVGGALNTVSKLSGGIGSGVAQLSFDEAYKEERSILKHEENPGDIAEGVIYGTKALGKGLYLGVSGIVMEPIRGAKRGGAHGFLKGLVKGVVGVAVKPVVGVLDTASNLTQGISGTATALVSKARTVRMRRPRLLYSHDRILKVYEEEEAYVKHLMECVVAHKSISVAASYYPEEYVTHVGLPNAKLLIVTRELVSLWSCHSFLDQLESAPTITWSLPLRDIAHINVSSSGKSVAIGNKKLVQNVRTGKIMYKVSSFIIPAGAEEITAAVLQRLHTIVGQVNAQRKS